MSSSSLHKSKKVNTKQVIAHLPSDDEDDEYDSDYDEDTATSSSYLSSEDDTLYDTITEDDEEEDQESSSEEKRKILKSQKKTDKKEINHKLDRTQKKTNKLEKLEKPEKSEKLSKEEKEKKKRKACEKEKEKENDKKKRIIKEEDEYDDEDDDDDYDESCLDIDKNQLTALKNGIILSFDTGGPDIPNDEADYEKMMEEEKHEECNSDDEKTFMKENYIPVKHQDQQINRLKKKTSMKKIKEGKEEKEEKEEEEEKTVELQYSELSTLKKELTEQLQKNPKSKILKNAIQECRHSISSLVRKERHKNVQSYYKLVHQDEHDKQNTNEMSYFKKKLSHREQMRVMQDLKEINAFANTDKPYRLALLESNIPAKYKAIALQKLNVLKSMEPGDSEYYKMKNWVDGFMRVPFGIHKSLSVSIKDGVDKCHQFISNAKETLEQCTYGLNDAKLQILQLVGQWISNPSAIGTAIAIRGPPGTGKTTLIKDGISKILGREFAFIALGGTGDASFLEGHSYTYEGSSWGKILSILMESKCMNPVIFFDELDKISDTPRGEEIVSILTHLTDTTQNNQFHDKYFSEVDFDLSKCLFIFSYNDESKVNSILKDRMYRIQTKGYDTKEKTIIAKNHLLPKIREQVGFLEKDVILPDETIHYIISNEKLCNNEQGVRNLKRCLEIIHTKLNLFRLIKPDQNIFAKDMEIDVQFPFTVLKKHVDILVKNDDSINPSMLAMYI